MVDKGNSSSAASNAKCIKCGQSKAKPTKSRKLLPRIIGVFNLILLASQVVLVILSSLVSLPSDNWLEDNLIHLMTLQLFTVISLVASFLLIFSKEKINWIITLYLCAIVLDQPMTFIVLLYFLFGVIMVKYEQYPFGDTLPHTIYCITAGFGTLTLLPLCILYKVILHRLKKQCSCGLEDTSTSSCTKTTHSKTSSKTRSVATQPSPKSTLTDSPIPGSKLEYTPTKEEVKAEKTSVLPSNKADNSADRIMQPTPVLNMDDGYEAMAPTNGGFDPKTVTEYDNNEDTNQMDALVTQQDFSQKTPLTPRPRISRAPSKARTPLKRVMRTVKTKTEGSQKKSRKMSKEKTTKGGMEMTQ